MATAVQRIHTIYDTSPSSSSLMGTSSSFDLTPGGLSPMPPRTTPASLPSSPVKRARSGSFRRTAPPPPRRVPAPRLSIPTNENPFGDESGVITLIHPSPISVSSSSPRASQSSRAQQGSTWYSYSSYYQPPGLYGGRSREQAEAERDARLKVIAGILLHRVHCHVKPMRRRVRVDPCTGAGVQREYIRSGLSSMVTAE
ncbi:hypothetical protein JAAARDRAFT_33520 [Jaapia argillacea MUCL 33604]|uniref:Uncharacterized protein n=1 Tax=Jaapia argillacea MUCL 33604 TaxID=933084 RepID=A0A067QBI9_9AGAM|nr:hypothetical protein JAAARDRAFT_33520 [Jaapia argillacea MUCL 33604]